MRDLNKEYKDMVLDETPDIWSKIEEGLDERRRVADAQPQIKAGPKHKILKFRRMPLYISAVAAAAVCIFVVIPVLKGSNSATTADSAMPRHVRESADSAATGAAETEAYSDNAAFDMAESAEAEASDGASLEAKRQYAISPRPDISGVLNMDEAPMANEEAAEASAEPAEEDDTMKTEDSVGINYLVISFAGGASKDNIQYLIDEFSLELYEEDGDFTVFVIPDGVDLKELQDLADEDENIAYGEKERHGETKL